MDMDPEQASAEAIHKAKNAQQAVEVARYAQIESVMNSDRFALTVEDAVIRAFKAGIGDGRYIDVSRIPLICQSIVGIDKKLDDLVNRGEFKPVQAIAYGLVGLVLSSVVGALMLLILRQ